ncbi:Co2+/Mg2+ efflux protein ApaG [Nitrococcus mobilis]|uniref:Protein ApaG n=1 Tax=Nitrococcus mobilis Nb-231 TaxID=314278 RepID=A4BMR8_9GAMM|nr:Co2+/Mg2+ efflux protein ApaG [Nitrococcus mobilis]EAR23606.1 hypothetical protein NB231_17338 [Nitrococcus mobilis Nb-231]
MVTYEDNPYFIRVEVESVYVEEESVPDRNRYAFAYTVTIRNEGAIAAKLLTRHWIISNANGEVQEVHGEGVVGEQPHLGPGECFQYTSGTFLDTEFGSMRGSYQMLADDGVHFDAEIPVFSLSVPHTFH